MLKRSHWNEETDLTPIVSSPVPEEFMMTVSRMDRLAASQSSSAMLPVSSLPPTIQDAWQSILALIDGQRLDEARERIDHYLSLYPTDPQLWIQQGNVLWKQNLLAEAELAYRHAMQLAPESAAACWCLVLLYQHMDRTEEAMLWYRRAIRSGVGRSASASQSLGVTLF